MSAQSPWHFFISGNDRNAITKTGMPFLCAMLLLCSFAAGYARELRGDAPRVGAEHELIVPDKLWSAIVRSFPDFRLPAAEDYLAGGSNSEAYYIFLFADTTLPYACWGDFNGDGWWDVATFLVPEARDSAGVKLVVFHGSPDGFTPLVLRADLPRRGYTLFTLGTLAPGKILTVKGKGYQNEYPPDFPDAVRTTCDSIEYGKFGSAARMYYWKEGHYEEVAISD